MAIIETDNPEIKKELIALERLIEQSGGGMHSNVVIRDQGGSLSLETKERMAPGKEILRLSRDTLLPADQYDVFIKKGKFSLEFPKASSLSATQKKLAETMISLYNLTDKVKLHQDFSFLLSIVDYPELIEKIKQGRLFGKNLLVWLEGLDQGMKEADFNAFLSESFLKTRYLGYGDHLRTSEVSILMPVVDFLNHHWQGAAFHIGLGVRKGDLAVTANQVVEGSLECYAFYGIMDSFDTLVRYDFVDDYAPVVRSVPIVLEVENFGTIKVNSTPGAVNNKKLGKQIADLSRFVPNMTTYKGKQVMGVSHLLIPVDGSPRALRRVLYILLANMAGDTKLDKKFYDPWIRDAESKILEKNNLYYRELLDLAKKLTEEKGDTPGLERIRHLANVQLRKLEQYQLMDVYEENMLREKVAQGTA